MARLEHQLQAIEEDLKELRAFEAHLKKNKGNAKGFKYHSDFVVRTPKKLSARKQGDRRITVYLVLRIVIC